MAHSFTSDEAPRKAGALEMQFVDDRLVVFENGDDPVHCLNATAALVFELCDGKRPVSAIIDSVRDAYNLPEPPADEIMSCLLDLRTAGILE